MTTAAAEQIGDVRRLVLDAAIAIIEIDGAESLSMREVARRAGVSHQAPYHYFGDRSGIFAAISEEGFTLLADAFSRTGATNETASKVGLSTYVRFARENTGHFRVMFRADISGTSTHRNTEIAAERAFTELLLMVKRTIGAPKDPSEALPFALMMWSQAHGLATLMVDGPLERKFSSDGNMMEMVDAVIDLASHMVSLEVAEMGLLPTQN